jgi:hypothetical protein
MKRLAEFVLVVAMGEKPEQRPRGVGLGKCGALDLCTAWTLSFAGLNKLVADPIVVRGVEVELLAFNIIVRIRNRFNFGEALVVRPQEDDEVISIRSGLREVELLDVVLRSDMAALHTGRQVFAKGTKVFFHVLVNEKNLATNAIWSARERAVSQEVFQHCFAGFVRWFLSQPYENCSLCDQMHRLRDALTASVLFLQRGRPDPFRYLRWFCERSTASTPVDSSAYLCRAAPERPAAHG